MNLTEIQIRKFRNIIDSEPVQIQSDITCLVGKNESGKTAFLHALCLLNPARPNIKFSIHDQYPAWLEKRDRQSGIKLEESVPISATFELDETEVKLIEDDFGKDVLTSRKLSISRTYGEDLKFSIESSESKFVSHLIGGVNLPHGIKTKAGKIKTIEELENFIKELEKNEREGSEEQKNVAKSLHDAKQKKLEGENLTMAIEKVLKKRLPRFLYFSNYSKLPYSVDIKKLLQAELAKLSEEELTARSLLTMAAAEDAYLINPDYERRKRELENVANALTADVLKYWTQNPELRVQPDITQTTVDTPQGRQAVIDQLKIRIWDNRHSLSLPFNEHSSGFQWFFSFLAAFSEFEGKTDPVIILLDEPALGLHARAQADFLRFIEDRLAPSCQVIYTTHSPFMVQPGRLERVRLVEDRGQEYGAKITADVTSTDPDTLFPLQGALGYELVQHLFIAPNNLVVEGTSDFTYLSVISDYFRAEGQRQALNEQWSIVPVGGADLIPTFVALLGQHLNVTVLIDSRKTGYQKLSNLSADGILEANRIIAVGHVLGSREADIEDLFSEDDYLNFYNKAFNSSLTKIDIPGSDAIVKRIARYHGVHDFDHGRPADFLLRHRDEILPTLSKKTLDRFETLFKKINATLPTTP
jgi:predicted ATP-dependent endonuclease of OLD family